MTGTRHTCKDGEAMLTDCNHTSAIGRKEIVSIDGISSRMQTMTLNPKRRSVSCERTETRGSDSDRTHTWSSRKDIL